MSQKQRKKNKKGKRQSDIWLEINNRCEISVNLDTV